MIRILTDSAADLTPADRDRPGVTVVPLQVVFSNGDTALDGVDITGDAYYERLKGEEKLPRTSQPSPDQFIEVFEQARAAGDQVVAVLLSSTLSGTWQCARLAAETCEFEDLWVVDSRTGSQGEAVLVREALRLRDEQGCVCVEMESFALFANAQVLGKHAACLLTISDSFVSPEATTAEQRQKSFTNMMKVALGADY